MSITTIPSHAVRRATGADAGALARSLADAFHEDPVFRWAVPEDSVRRRHLPAVFRVVVDALLDHGEVHCTADALSSALWVPAGTDPLTSTEGERFAEASVALGPLGVERFAAISAAMEASHPHEEHEYLWFLGAAAAVQGQGRGSALLDVTLAQCDRRGSAAYLEATSERNRALYRRHGFEDVGTVSATGSPTMWAMWRDPR